MLLYSIQIEPVSYRVVHERKRVHRTEARRPRRTTDQEEGVQEEAQTSEDDGPRRIDGTTKKNVSS